MNTKFHFKRHGFENVNGDGSAWVEHPIDPSTPHPPDFHPYDTFNATCSVVYDVDRDSKNDIVFTDAEIPDDQVWWMENVDGKGQGWRRHDI